MSDNKLMPCVCGNTMQTSLQTGWTSEVPSESGGYVFRGSINGFFHAHALVEVCTAYAFIARIIGEDSDFRPHDFKGLWYRINYPQPPQDQDNDKD